MENILETYGLSKRYKDKLALDEVSLSIRKGAILGLVGKNGAGKTTLIRVLTDVAKPSGGSYSLFGETDPAKFPELRRKIASMIEKPAFYAGCSAEFNLETQLILNGYTGDLKPVIEEQLRFVGLEEVLGKKKSVSNFSLGMRQRLGIAMALVKEPELLLLDEPTNGLDPEGIKQIRDLLIKLNQEKGITILVSSHILSELSLLATEYVFMDHGKIVGSVRAAELEKGTAKSLHLVTSDQEQAKSLLEENGYSAEMKGDELVVTGHQESADVVKLLLKKKIDVSHFHEVSHGLEDFFLSLLQEENQ